MLLLKLLLLHQQLLFRQVAGAAMAGLAEELAEESGVVRPLGVLADARDTGDLREAAVDGVGHVVGHAHGLVHVGHRAVDVLHAAVGAEHAGKVVLGEEG